MRRLFLVGLLLSTHALASPPRYRVGPMTEFPSHTGIDGQLELSRHFHFLVQGGIFIGPYASVVRDLGEDLGFFNANTGQLIEDLLPGSSSLRVGLGTHDWLFKGSVLEFAYTYLGGGGDSASETDLGAVVNADLTGEGINGRIPTSTSVHWLSVHLGYRLKFAPGWHFVTRVGITHPIGSSSSVQLSDSNLQATVNPRLDEELNRFYQRVWLPVVSFSVVFGLGGRPYPEAARDPRSL